MRFLITTEHYYPKLNGVQIKTQELAEYLIKKGHQVEIITSNYQNTITNEIINGVKIFRINLRTKRSLYIGEKAKYLNLIKTKIKGNDVYINIASQNGFTDIPLNHIKNFKTINILYFHGMAHFSFPNVSKIDLHDIFSWFLNISRWKLYYYFNKKKFTNYDFTIHLHKEDATFDMVKSDKFKKIIIENINSTSEIKKTFLRDNYHLNVSNYTHDKNQVFVLRAYYISNTKRKLVFVGSTHTEYLIKLKKIKLRLDKIHGFKEVDFVVNEKRDITLKRFEKAFVFLFGSKNEKYPIVISEAMSNSLPYISTDVGIVKYLKGGIIAQTVKEMAHNIDKVETNEKLYLRLATDGYNYSYNTNNFNNSMEELLPKIERELINKNE